MFTMQFWRDLGERALKTFAQTVGAAFATAGLSLTVTTGRTVLINAAVAALLSAVSSLGSLPLGDGRTASLLRSLRPGRHEAGHSPV